LLKFIDDSLIAIKLKGEVFFSSPHGGTEERSPYGDGRKLITVSALVSPLSDIQPLA
jgi:hypothetical protein